MRKYYIALLLCCTLVHAQDDYEILPGSEGVRYLGASTVPTQPADPWLTPTSYYAGRWLLYATNPTPTNVLDSSGNGFTGAVSGVTWTDGVYTNTYGQVGARNYYDGVDDNIIVGDRDLLSLTNGSLDGDIPFTVFFWARNTGTVDATTTILSKGAEWEVYGANNLYLYDKTAVNRNKYILFAMGSGTTTQRWNCNVVSYDGNKNANWYHNYGTASAAAPNLTNLVVMSVTTTDVSYVCMSNTTGVLKIGAARDGLTTYNWKGEIHDLRILSGTNLTITEAQYMMTNTVPTNHIWSMFP